MANDNFEEVPIGPVQGDSQWEEVSLEDSKKKSQSEPIQSQSLNGSTESQSSESGQSGSGGPSTVSLTPFPTQEQTEYWKEQGFLPGYVQLEPVEIKPEQTPLERFQTGLNSANLNLTEIDKKISEVEDFILKQDSDSSTFIQDIELAQTTGDQQLLSNALKAADGSLMSIDEAKSLLEALKKEKESTSIRKSMLEAGIRNVNSLNELDEGFVEGTVNRAKYVYDKMLEGIGSLSAGASDLMLQALVNIPGMVPEGMTKEEAIKQFRSDIIPSIREGTREVAGVEISPDKEKQYNDEFITSAIGGLASSAPAMISPYGSGLFLQAYDSGIKNINSTEKGKELPETTKTIFAATVGLAQAALEKYGLDKVFEGSSQAATGLATNTLLDLLKTGDKITKESVNIALEKAVNTLKDKGTDVIQASLIEGGTGALGELSTVLAEKGINTTEGENIFEPKSWGEEFGRIMLAGGQEAVGGTILGGVKGLTQSKVDLTQRVMEADGDVSKLDDLFQSIDVYGKEVDEDRANVMRDKLEGMVARSTRIPSEITNVEARIQADEKLKELDQLRIHKEKLDEAFKPQIDEKIKGITNDLQTIASTNSPIEQKEPVQAVPIMEDEKVVSEKITLARKELDDAKANFRLATQGLSSFGQLQALPEFVNLVKAYAKLGGVKIEEQIQFIREALGEKIKDYSDDDIKVAAENVLKEPKDIVLKPEQKPLSNIPIEDKDILEKTVGKKLKKKIEDFAFAEGRLIGNIEQAKQDNKEFQKEKKLAEKESQKLIDKAYGFGFAEGREGGKLEQAVSDKNDFEKEKSKLSKSEQERIDKAYEIGLADGVKKGSEMVDISKMISDYINKDKEFKSMINKSESAKTVLFNKLNKLMSATESKDVTRNKRLEELLDYLDKLEQDGMYQEKLDLANKERRGAIKKKHESEYIQKVREFSTAKITELSPELLDKYNEAIGDVNQKVPNYRKMNEIFDEVVKKKEQDDYYRDKYELINNSGKIVQDIVTNPINSVEDYMNLLRDTRNLRRNLEDLSLFGTEAEQAKTNEDLENLNDFINQKSKEFEEAVKPLKESQIKEIKENYSHKETALLTSEDKDLLKEFESLSEEDLMSLGVSDLQTLSESFDRLKDGDFPYNQINNVVLQAKANKGINKITKQLEQPKDKGFYINLKDKYKKWMYNNKDSLVRALGEQDLAFMEDILGLKGHEITKYLVSPMSREITKMKYSINDKFNRLNKATPLLGNSEKSKHKIGMIMNILRDYHRVYNPNSIEPTRDWFGELLKNEVDMKEMSSRNQKVLRGVYEDLKKGYERPDGMLDVDKLVSDFKNNPYKFLSQNELKYYNVVRDINKELATKQKAVNEAQGKPFNEEEWYVRRFRLGGASDVSTEAIFDSIRKRSGSGKEITTDKVGPIETDIEKIIQRSIYETEKDYHTYNADLYTNKVLSGVIRNAKESGINEDLSRVIKDEMRLRGRHEFSTTANDNLVRNLKSAKVAYSLFDLGRSGIETISSLVGNPIRTGTGIKSFSVFTPSEWKMANQLIKDTGSSLILKNVQREIIQEGTTSKIKGGATKIQEKIISLPEHITYKTIWLPTFYDNFREITGENFSDSKYNSSKLYREKYSQEIKDAGAVADKTTKKVVGPQAKFEGRRLVQFSPEILGKIFGFKSSVDANSIKGQSIGFFGNYLNREANVFTGGLDKMASGKFSEGLRESSGILIQALTYSTLSGLYSSLKRYLLEDDEERFNEELEKATDVNNYLESMGYQMGNIISTKYGWVGRELAYMAAMYRYSHTENKEEKKKIEDFMRDNLFKSPIKNYGDWAVEMVNVMPAFGYLAKESYDAVGGEDGINNLVKKLEEGQSISENERNQLQLLGILVDAANLIGGATMGLTIPAKKSIDRYIKNEVKEEKKTKKPTDEFQGEFIEEPFEEPIEMPYEAPIETTEPK